MKSNRTYTVDEINQQLIENPPAQYQGSLQDRYDIYLACTDEKYPKTFDEWVNS